MSSNDHLVYPEPSVSKIRNLLVLVLSACLLCGSIVAAQQDAVSLTFVAWGNAEEDAVMQVLVDQFNAENADIQIEYTLLADYHTELNAALEAGNPPDIALIPDWDFWNLASKGLLANLQPLVDQSGYDTAAVWPSALDRFRMDLSTFALGTGDLYALPKDIGPMMLYINEDLFEAAGVPLPDPVQPMTWDTLVATATQLTLDSSGRTPSDAGFEPDEIVQVGLADVRWEIAVYGNGGRIVSNDGRTFVGATDPNTLQALQWLSDLRHVHHVTPLVFESDEVTPSQMFAEGDAAMITDGRWQVPNFRANLPFEWSIRPNPVGPSGMLTTYGDATDCRASGWSSSTGIGVIAGSDGETHLPEAFRFIAFLTGPEAQAAQAELDFALSNQIAHTTDDSGAAAANSAAVREAARCAVPPPWTLTPYYGTWFDPLFWDGVWPDVVLDNALTASEAFTARADAFQQGLDEAWAELAAG